MAASVFWYDGAGSTTERCRLNTTAASARSINAGSTLTDGAADTLPHTHTCIFAGAQSQYLVDGAIAVAGDAGSQPLQGITLFANRSSTGSLPGSIGELLVYSGSHSAAQRRLVERYLSERWAQ